MNATKETGARNWLKSGWIDEWTPDEPTFWERTGKRIAWKNLVISIPANCSLLGSVEDALGC